MYGAIPPDKEAVALPFDSPLQTTSLTKSTLSTTRSGSFITTDAVVVQAFASETVTI